MVDLTKLSKRELTRQLQTMLKDKQAATDEEAQQRLIHELRVHEIELEMQNRQLRDTQQQLESSRDRYSELYDLAPVGYLTLTEKGLIEQINLNGAMLLSRPREQLTGMPLSTFLSGPDRPHFFSYLKNVLASHDRVSTELHLQKNGQPYRCVFVKSIAVRDAQGKATACRCALIDISDRKQAEDQLKQAYDELEQRVEQRTGELQRANEQLRAEAAAREEMAKELQESEAHYRQVVDTQTELICRYRPDTTLTFVNEAYCRYFQKPREELVGHSYLPVIPPQSRARSEAYLASFNKDKPVDTLEIEVNTPNGELRWQRWTTQASFDEQGQVIEYQSIGDDITEIRQAELELKESEARYRSVVESQNELICRWRPGGIITFVNEAYCRYFNKPREQLVDHSFMPYIPPEDHAAIEAHFASINKDNPVATHEHRVIMPNGEVRWQRWTNQANFDEQGQIIEFQSVGIDITERREAELERARYYEQLQESEARYRLVVDSQSELICRYRPDTILTFVNEAYCRGFHKTREELIGQSYLQFVPPEYREIIRAYLDTLNKDKPVDTIEVQVNTPSGEIRWQRWTTEASFDEQGQITEIQAIGKDVTEIRKAERELARYHEHLEDMVAMRTADLEANNREMESFSYAIAHDLRTPLRAITSYSQVLLLDATPKLNDDELNSLNRIVSAGKYMAQLIDDILNLAKVSRSELHLESVDLSAQCQHVMKVLNQSEPGRAVTWNIRPGIKVLADRKAVSLIVDNLLENAWKFTRHNPEAMIEVGTTHERGMGVFYVKDNGVGFDMQYAHRLFREFERLHGKEFEGSGIGLATVRHIVERHGGSLWVHAVQDEGATFYVHLPSQEEIRKKSQRSTQEQREVVVEH
jgi:PAS domain S-box-containing protein